VACTSHNPQMRRERMDKGRNLRLRSLGRTRHGSESGLPLQGSALDCMPNREPLTLGSASIRIDGTAARNERLRRGSPVRSPLRYACELPKPTVTTWSEVRVCASATSVTDPLLSRSSSVVSCLMATMFQPLRSAYLCASDTCTLCCTLCCCKANSHDV
jgi:hypothetical protein